MMFSIAIRFLPILKEDIENILLAQNSRNVFANKGGKIFFYKLKYFSASISSLLVGLFEKADNLAVAMENRGYVPSTKRSFYYQHSYRMSDLIFIIVIGMILTFFIFMAIEGGEIIPRIGDVEY